jgi:hypothetical protein
MTFLRLSIQKKRWTADLLQQFPKNADLKKIRAQNLRLMNIIEDPLGKSLRHVVDFNGKVIDMKRPPSRLFLGSDFMAGVVPPSAMVGDMICQFWNSSASAVLRKDKHGYFQVVGRAGVVQQGNSMNWDILEDKWMFTSQSPQVIEVSVDILTLTMLSLDTVNLPISE